MKIIILTIEFYLEGCRSLKEKRRRISGLRDRFGKNSNIAVCESNYNDDHKRSEWSFVVVCTNQKIIDKDISRIKEWAATRTDATVTDMFTESV